MAYPREWREKKIPRMLKRFLQAALPSRLWVRCALPLRDNCTAGAPGSTLPGMLAASPSPLRWSWARIPASFVRVRKCNPTPKGFDKLIVTLYTLLTLALPIFAGLDAVRFQWAPLPFVAVYFGGALFLLSMIPIGWALAVNPYLETTVRIPKRTRSRAIPSRPYRFNATSRVCRSLEDRMLRNQLPGYAEYARRTPYRLLPALW